MIAVQRKRSLLDQNDKINSRGLNNAEASFSWAINISVTNKTSF